MGRKTVKTYITSGVTEFDPPPENEYIVVNPIDGTRQWFKVFIRNGIRIGRLHRLDNPAWVDTTGSETWFKNGYFHRIGGPAFTDRVDDVEEWWIMGIEIDSYEEYQKMTKCSDEEILLLTLKWGDIEECT